MSNLALRSLQLRRCVLASPDVILQKGLRLEKR